MFKTLCLSLSIAIFALPACKKNEAGKAAPDKEPATDKMTPPPAEPTTPPAEPTTPPAAATPPAASAATAELKPASGSKVSGTVSLAEKDGKVELTIHATGLTPGDHGFHIHEKGDCSAPDATSAGGHFNPGHVDHGSPDAMPHHAGDFGNVTADDKGNVDKTISVDFVHLSGPDSAVGKAFILHEKADDLKTQPTGNAGARVACGVIAAK